VKQVVQRDEYRAAEMKRIAEEVEERRRHKVCLLTPPGTGFGLGFWFWGFEIRASGFGFWVSGLVFLASGIGLWGVRFMMSTARQR
jgi:hypothetical protein